MPPRPPTVGDVALRVDSLVKRFGNIRAIADVSLRVTAGELATLLGPSGCGKSTLLRCVAGIEPLDDGEIFIGNQLASSTKRGISVSPEHRRVGMVFQSYALWPHMTVARNVGYPLDNLGLSREERRRRVAQALQAVRLVNLDQRYPGELSGGQQQRVAVARAIVGDPQILLFDEPLSNLDAQLRDEMRNEIKRLQVERHLTMLYVTHDQQEALALADRILVMNEGQILQEGTPEMLYRRPATVDVARFLGASNTVAARLSGDGKAELADGSSLPCQVFGPASGEQIVIVCTPQAFRLLDQPGKDSVSGRIQHSGFLGVGYEHVIQLATGETIVAHSRKGPFTPGTRVNVTVHEEAAFAFPRSDE